MSRSRVDIDFFRFRQMNHKFMKSLKIVVVTFELRQAEKKEEEKNAPKFIPPSFLTKKKSFVKFGDFLFVVSVVGSLRIQTVSALSKVKRK